MLGFKGVFILFCKCVIMFCIYFFVRFIVVEWVLLVGYFIFLSMIGIDGYFVLESVEVNLFKLVLSVFW